MLILHFYLARELLKTFLMTSVTLTLLVVMGGGVANIFRGEAVGAEGMAKIFLFLTPVAITLILPVAALFSAAITYGRAAADNEILACRAAGINIHKLLLSALVLGVFVTLFTLWSWNYLLPTLSQQIENLTRNDLPNIVMGQFQKAKPLAFGRYRMTARQCTTLDQSSLAQDVPTDHAYLQLSGVAFCEAEDEEAVRFGTADITIVDFDRSEAIPRVTVDLQGVRSFDSTRKQYYELAHQVLGPFTIPLSPRRKMKFETVGTLLSYRHRPELIPDVADKLVGAKREMMAHCLYQDVVRQLDPALGGDGTYRLAGGGMEYDISAEQFAVDPEDGKPSLRGVKVIEKGGETGDRQLTADAIGCELLSSNPRASAASSSWTSSGTSKSGDTRSRRTIAWSRSRRSRSSRFCTRIRRASSSSLTRWTPSSCWTPTRRLTCTPSRGGPWAFCMRWWPSRDPNWKERYTSGRRIRSWPSRWFCSARSWVLSSAAVST